MVALLVCRLNGFQVVMDPLVRADVTPTWFPDASLMVTVYPNRLYEVPLLVEPPELTRDEQPVPAP
jgi:hypothetical protein